MLSTVFTVKGSLQFGIDSYRLTSERNSLTHQSSRACVSNNGSSCLNFIGTDEATLRHLLIVLDFVADLSIVLPCARHRE